MDVVKTPMNKSRSFPQNPLLSSVQDLLHLERMLLNFCLSLQRHCPEFLNILADIEVISVIMCKISINSCTILGRNILQYFQLFIEKMFNIIVITDIFSY